MEANAPVRWVVCAANRNGDGIVVCGARHFDNVMRRAIEAMHIPCKNLFWEQGFIDNRGNFLTRPEAMKLAIASKQVEDRGITDLYSEDLY